MFKQLLTLGLAAFVAVGTAGASHWGYSGKHAPEHWGNLDPAFSACKNGREQSPVNVNRMKHKGYAHLQLNYPVEQLSIFNNGHSVEVVPLLGRYTMKLDGKVYELKQFHFHTPSEHTYDGKHYPMEVHFVHQAKNGAVCVLAVNYKKGNKNRVLASLLKQKLHDRKPVRVKDLADIRGLFPVDKRVITFRGSLTTPPCTEGVKWVIFNTPMTASSKQIEKMHEMIGFNNNRPVQPLNGRKFKLSR